MTLNAPWIKRLTLRSQVIRETKGQAKQEEDPQPQLPCLCVPPPPSKEESKCTLAQTHILLTLPPLVHDGAEQKEQKGLLSWRETKQGSLSGWGISPGCLIVPAEVNVEWKLAAVWRKHPPEIFWRTLTDILKVPFKSKWWWLFSCTCTNHERKESVHGNTHLVHLTTLNMKAYKIFFGGGGGGWECRNLQQFSLK